MAIVWYSRVAWLIFYRLWRTEVNRFSRRMVSHCGWEFGLPWGRLDTARRLQPFRYRLGRGCGVGRTLGMGVPLGVGVGRGVEVAVGVGVGVGDGAAHCVSV